MDKSLILKEIKKHYNFKTDGEFADFLGIKQNTLSNWSSRNSIDYDRIISKCEDIDGNWLLTGQGSMLKSESKNEVPPPPETHNTVGLEQLRKENAMQAKIIEGLEFKVDTLEKELSTLKKAPKDPILYKNVAEPAPELIKKMK
jgi:hypothetical protein